MNGLYQVSNLGRVKSLKRKNVPVTKILTPRYDKDGYQLINLSLHNHKTTYKLHRLVALAFIPNPDGLPEVNHEDENKANNRVDNLKWCTVQYNNTFNNRNKKLPQNQLNNKYTSKPIRCIETNIIYPSISEAGRQLGHRVIMTQKTSNGYHWEYVDERRDVKC